MKCTAAYVVVVEHEMRVCVLREQVKEVRVLCSDDINPAYRSVLILQLCYWLRVRHIIHLS